MIRSKPKFKHSYSDKKQIAQSVWAFDEDEDEFTAEPEEQERIEEKPSRPPKKRKPKILKQEDWNLIRVSEVKPKMVKFAPSFVNVNPFEVIQGEGEDF